MRHSHIDRVFTTMVDYNVSAYEKLVTSTLSTFASETDRKLYVDLKRNHNNVSHTKVFGAIQKNHFHYELTPAGKRLYNDPSQFRNMFNEQALAFSLQYRGSILFPYRAMLKVMLQLDSLNQFEFVVAPFLMKGTSDKDIQDAVDRVKMLRHLYGNVRKISNAQKALILRDVNSRFGLSLVFNDVWTKRTSAYNQFGYFGNHLSSLVQSIKQRDGKIVKDAAAGNAEIQSVLNATASVESLSGNPAGLLSYYSS